MQKKLEVLGYRVSAHTYSPGTYFPPHTHGMDKIDAVLSGSFRIGMGKESVVLQAGDWIHVPCNAEHEAEVIGNEPVVSLDAVKSR
ncbi:MAG: cupin domain-containing protein [Candidatus Korobacteraceae bacterium]